MTDPLEERPEKTQSIVLCEGYHDRAFWAGWLLSRLGCTDPGDPSGKSAREKVMDPWERLVVGGDFGFRSASGHFIRVTPCHGKQNILPIAEGHLKRRRSWPLTALVLAADSDLEAGVDGQTTGPNPQAILNLLQSVGRADTTEIGWIAGDTPVWLVRWAAQDSPSQNIPSRETLERLVCAALVAAYPDRGPAVRQWLASPARPAETGPKNHLWSHMAGWFAEHGCDDFFRRLWDNQSVAAQLEQRLRATGAWGIAETLTR